MESEHKEEWDKDMSRKLSSTAVGSKGEMAASPLVGPERKKSTAVPSVSEIFFPSLMGSTLHDSNNSCAIG